jgi:uncharacterized protein (DUF1330 family)
MSGAVPAEQKHVVALELVGPKDEKEYAAFRDAVEALARQHGARIIIRARGKQ